MVQIIQCKYFNLNFTISKSELSDKLIGSNTGITLYSMTSFLMIAFKESLLKVTTSHKK